MNKVKIVAAVPSPELRATNDHVIRSSELNGKTGSVLLPQGQHPGCTTEGQDFRDHYQEFLAFDTVVLGVSKDSTPNPTQEHCFPFDLIF